MAPLRHPLSFLPGLTAKRFSGLGAARHHNLGLAS